MSKSKKLLVSIFIVFNFLTMLRIYLPLETKFFRTIYKPIDSYLSFFSIYQDWMMFAPNPSRVNFKLKARVEFSDGVVDFFYFTHSGGLSLKQKYFFGEKFRKLVFDVAQKRERHFLCKDLAKFALRKMRQEHFNKIPIRVQLITIADEIPDIKDEFRLHHQSHQFKKVTPFYTYEVI
jgi:hypothetical protein